MTNRETLTAELRHIGAEVKHAKGRLDSTLSAADSVIREAYEAGWTVDEVVSALGGPL